MIGSAVGGIKYTIQDGKTGYLIPPHSPDALAERMAFLCHHPEVMKAMGQEGLKRAHEHFTWSTVTRSIAALYEEVLTGNLIPFDVNTPFRTFHGEFHARQASRVS